MTPLIQSLIIPVNEMETCQVEGCPHHQNRFKLCPPIVHLVLCGFVHEGNLLDAMMLS